MKGFFAKGLIWMPLLGLFLLAAPVWAATDQAGDNAAATLATQQTVSGVNYGPIPDGFVSGAGSYGGSRDIRFTVIGLPGTVSGPGVSFSAAHPYVGDLRVRLIAPNGKQHLLFARTGAMSEGGLGFGSNLLAANTYDFKDSNSTNWWTATVASGYIASTNARTVISGGAGVSNPPPVTSMNASFAATPANGTWILRFEDGFSSYEGSVTAATLTLGSTGVTRVVTSINDSGAGSLREAMTLATTGDLIAFDPVLFGSPQTIELLTALPDITSNRAIEGPGAHLLTVRRSDTAANFRIFNISAVAANVAISGMTISNGNSNVGGGIRSVGSTLTLSRVEVSGNAATSSGGGLFVYRDVFIHASTIAGNTSGEGGGIAYEGNVGRSLRLYDSTVSGNKAGSYGGIIHYGIEAGTSTLEVVNSTVAYNTANAESGGIGTYTESSASVATTTLRNSIVANNAPNNVYTDASQGGMPSNVSSGYNLSDNWNGLTLATTDVTGNPRLGPLAPQGGTTPTHLLLGGSAALDKGNRSGAASDQRGVERAFDIASISNPTYSDGTDMGAVEMQAIIVTNVNDSGAGSLRAAISSANSSSFSRDDIIFDDSLFTTPKTIPLVTALPDISAPTTLSGPGAKLLSVRRSDTAPNFGIFHLGSTNIALSGMTISNGRSDRGGGVYIYSLGDLTLAEISLVNNTAVATDGGGLYVSAGNVLIIGSTISGNTAIDDCGGGIGVGNRNGNIVRLINSTVSANSAGSCGGGIYYTIAGANAKSRLEVINSTIAKNIAFNRGGIATEAYANGSRTTTVLRNSIIADNSQPNLSSNGARGVYVSRGFNLASDNSSAFLNLSTDQNNANAGLLPLADNGGPTFTHALTAFSDALDGGKNSGSGVTASQRGNGFARTVDLPLTNVPGGDGTDIGAYEAQSEPINDRLFASGFDF